MPRTKSTTAHIALSTIACVALGICAVAQQKSASLRGTVWDSTHHPVRGALVQLQGKSGEPLQVSSDAAGGYCFASVSPGTYRLQAEERDHGQSPELSLTIVNSEETVFDLNLEQKTSAPSQQSPAFFDQPSFAVSGVTDTTNLGGHGSDTIVKARNTIAKEASSLRSNAPAKASDNEFTLRQLVEREPKNAEAHHRLADIEEKLGHALDAVHEYQRAAELSPSEEYVFDWGSELLLHHAPEPAIDVFQKGNQLFPQSSRMLIGQGAAWFSLGSYDLAVQKVCAASDLDPDNPSPYLFLGLMDRTEPAPPDAVIEHLHRFATLHPESPEAKYHYAIALWKRGKHSNQATPQVENLLRDAVRLDPNFGLAHLQLGILYSERRDFQKAVAEYREAIRTAPVLDEPHYRLAAAYRRLGETGNAKAETEIYERMLKEEAQQAERERHEIQQFVYTLRSQPPPPSP